MKIDKELALQDPFLLDDKGHWKYEITKFEEKPAKDGTPMITLTARCVDHNGKAAFLKDWIKLDARNYSRLGDFCKSAKLEACLDKQELTDADCIGVTGICSGKTVIDQNGKQISRIDKWLVSKEDAFFNDDVPF